MTDVEQKQPHPTIYILPNLFTTGSIFVGFLAMVYSTARNFELASLLIVFGAFLDGLDGKVARITNTSSEFGVQYDSLADVITFGVAPAFICFQWKLFEFGRLGLVISFLYATCGALRLARFNISTAIISKKFFIGLPIPVGATTIASLFFFTTYMKDEYNIVLPDIIFPFITFCVSFLMVSQIKYFSFKEFELLHTRPFTTLLCIVLCLAALAVQPSLLLFVFAFTYILSGIIYSLLLIIKKSS